jgi:hypothetical protein
MRICPVEDRDLGRFLGFLRGWVLSYISCSKELACRILEVHMRYEEYLATVLHAVCLLLLLRCCARGSEVRAVVVGDDFQVG